MNLATNSLQGATNSAPTDPIEGSTFRLLISYIPLVGDITTIWNCNSLNIKIGRERINNSWNIQLGKETNNHKIVELIDVKNQYLFAGVGRSLLSAALLAIGIALDVIGISGILVLNIFGPVICVGLAGRYLYLIHQHNQLKNQLKKPGFKFGEEVSGL